MVIGQRHGRQDFLHELEKYVITQIGSQKVGYLLGAGSSLCAGYPLSSGLWNEIKGHIDDDDSRTTIDDACGEGLRTLEQALDFLDVVNDEDSHYRHKVTDAIARSFGSLQVKRDIHRKFVRGLAAKPRENIKIFSLNYDPLIEWACADERVRLVDGFHGSDVGFFEPSALDEKIGVYLANHRTRSSRFLETVWPLHLIKLHGSLGWFVAGDDIPKRMAYCDNNLPIGSRRLMVPPQRRKVNETMVQPYSMLWSEFRKCLGPGGDPINRLVTIGYGFADQHVNDVISRALARQGFNLLIFSRSLSDDAWRFWSPKRNVTIVTSKRSSLKGMEGEGHPDLWSFERLVEEI
jgi:hypothetical protein